MCMAALCNLVGWLLVGLILISSKLGRVIGDETCTTKQVPKKKGSTTSRTRTRSPLRPHAACSFSFLPQPSPSSRAPPPPPHLAFAWLCSFFIETSFIFVFFLKKILLVVAQVLSIHCCLQRTFHLFRQWTSGATTEVHWIPRQGGVSNFLHRSVSVCMRLLELRLRKTEIQNFFYFTTHLLRSPIHR